MQRMLQRGGPVREEGPTGRAPAEDQTRLWIAVTAAPQA
ncbi:hypothetical protein FM106_29910 [Brachybacterium faecium]|nr:hypothetical protein FM106_29910 [Brachybacterium faecium]